MARIAPSERIRQQINELLQQGLETSEDLSSLVIRLGTERLLQEMLEQEATDYLGRERHQRRDPAQPSRGYRNGYEPGRLRTTEGEMRVEVPALGMTIYDDRLEFGEAPEEKKTMTATDRATEFLRVQLRREPQRYSELLPKSEEQGISRWAVYRAKEALGVVAVNGFWSLPATRPPEQQEYAETQN